MADYKENIGGKTILVTGGAGAIGSNLARTLAEHGAKIVIILDDLSAGFEWNIPAMPNVLFVKGSVLDEFMLKRIFSEKPDIVYHLAAFFANQNSVDYPEKDLLVNGMGTLRIFEYASLCRTERVVYASSGCSIYGSAAPMPLKEEFMSLYLSTPYQITKMLGELYANFFHHHRDLRVVKPRFFNSYGPGEVPGQYRNVIPNFIYWAMRGEALPITGTGEETRDFTYVGDLVDGLLRAGYYKSAIGQEFNLASGVETKLSDLAAMINGSVGNTAGTKFVQRRKWDTKSRLLADICKARDLVGYEPKTTFSQGLQQTVSWFRKKWDKIESSASFMRGMSSAVRDKDL